MNATAQDGSLPIEIHDAETIVRGAKARLHLNKSKVKHQAFRPPPGKREVSVIRQLMGDGFCKDMSVEICKEVYAGVILLTAAQIRYCGSLIYDARQDYLGHAHIDHQFPPIERDEPAPPEFVEHCKKLAAAAVFLEDPNPTASGWTGEPMQRACPLPETPNATTQSH
jgi:hypothetical protein